ncbi:MAG: DUF4249 domain-containing protein [Spirosoma sp.]|nr:DUF4249 domain-containing protein [Spirosoma sp.]
MHLIASIIQTLLAAAQKALPASLFSALRIAAIQLLTGLFLLSSCVDIYRPPEISSPGTYLVVNGYFDSAPGAVTTISLSRTQNLADPKAPPAETKAQVSIESGTKAVYTLKENAAGAYTLTGVSPMPGQTYRLHIKTAGGKEYFSDYVPLVSTPPIDSVNWRPDDDGLQINVNAHDPTNSTRYYRWDFQSTWQYTALYNSLLELKGSRIIDRVDPVFLCWGSDVSTSIITTSTARLSQDVVSQFPLVHIPSTSFKLGLKYSILVRQIGLTQAGFDYYDQLAKITQNIGSIFDPQPTQITGNIRSATNASELALGFFRVGNVQSKRIFINRAQLPNAWRINTGLGGCQVDTMTLKDVLANQPALISVEDGTGNYFTSSLECADCRARGGVTKQPDFWK